ncbi:MAG: hypothetical protein ACK5QC_16505 [Bacteroidota bacterium]
MKVKLAIIIFIIVLPNLFIGQTQKIVINKKDIKIGNVIQQSCSYNADVNLETNDTSYYVIISFKNLKYPNISDYKSIIFFKSNADDFFKFKQDYTKAIEVMESENETSFTGTNYRLVSGRKMIYLYNISESEPPGYSAIYKKTVNKLKEWLDIIEIQ